MFEDCQLSREAIIWYELNYASNLQYFYFLGCINTLDSLFDYQKTKNIKEKRFGGPLELQYQYHSEKP